jgi:hypothetical protein
MLGHLCAWAGGQEVLADRSAQDGMLQVEAAPQPPPPPHEKHRDFLG